jgi:hypothetical protein
MRILLIASLAAISACTAVANPPVLTGASAEPALAVEAQTAQFASADVDCDIRAVRTAHGVRLEASAVSEGGASGEYEFVITKRDRGGSSDIVQGGEYDLIAGDMQSLGSAEVSVERGGAYRARLVLRDMDGVACNAETSR